MPPASAGQHIQAGEQAETGIETMLAHMRVALGSQQLERQEGQQVAQRWDLLAPRQSGDSDHLWEPQLLKKWRKQKHSGRWRIEALSLQFLDAHLLRFLGDVRTLDGPVDLEPCAPWQLCEPFFGQHTLHGAHRDLQPLLQEQLCDLGGGKSSLAPGANLLTCLGADTPSPGRALGRRLGKVKLAAFELMAQQMDIAGGVTESVGNDVGG
jgi:hypothetical protein